MKGPRLPFRVALLLLLGGIVNIAVAWGCKLVFVPEYKPYTRTYEGERPLTRGEANEILRRLFPKSPIVAEEAYGTTNLQIGWSSVSAAWVKDTPESEDSGWHIYLETSVIEAGWPMRSLFGCYLIDDWDSGDGWERGFIDSPLWADRNAQRSLPIEPIWPGFALNTLFYATILYLLFAAPGVVRRRIRTKRGQCPACAYPIGTSEVCTECGALLPLPPGAGEGRGEGTPS